MKIKRVLAMGLAATMTLSLAACGSNDEGGAANSGADGKKRVCFVARASADTFAAWFTSSMKEEAKNYPDIDLTCVIGEADDNTENGLLEDCITKQYDLAIVQSIIMRHRHC